MCEDAEGVTNSGQKKSRYLFTTNDDVILK